jgi:PPOX class probable F420-dependent enzyme
MNSPEQFNKKQYLNLETFRKNGESMKTPVWFVQDGETIYVQTAANSGKVKRIRNNGRVNVTPCKMDGTPTGTWVPANAKEIADADVFKKVTRLLEKKYGLMKKLTALGAARQGRQDTILEIEFSE